MKKVKCESGLAGWQGRLKEFYTNFEEFENYCNTFGIAERLGYSSPEEAWEDNPICQGSIEPSDLRVVISKDNKVYP